MFIQTQARPAGQYSSVQTDKFALLYQAVHINRKTDNLFD